MTKQVLFIQGAGNGAHEEDKKLVDNLGQLLGNAYEVIYPKMPCEDQPAYKPWKKQIAKEFDALKSAVILVGHSLGGSVLLKYTTEAQMEIPLLGLFLIAPPYWGAPDWQVDEFTLRSGFTSQLPKNLPLYFYHSRDDEIVPFAHLAMYKDMIPQATVQAFDSHGGHQFNNDLSAVAQDIKDLIKKRVS